MKKSIKEFSNDEIRKISKILSDEIPDDNEIEFMREEENYWGIDEELIEIWNNILNEEENKIMIKKYDKFEEYLKMNHQRIEFEYSNDGINIFLMMDDIMIINEFLKFDELNYLEGVLESFIFDYGNRFWKYRK